MGVPLDPTMGLTAVVVCLSATAFVAVDSAQSIGHACEGEDTVTTTEYWECNWDGSDECTMVELDCTSGTETSGSVTYEANGLMHATGPGWDCRHKCRGKRGTSGSQKRTSHGSAGGGSSGGGSTPGGSFGGGSRPGGSFGGGSRPGGSGSWLGPWSGPTGEEMCEWTGPAINPRDIGGPRRRVTDVAEIWDIGKAPTTLRGTQQSCKVFSTDLRGISQGAPRAGNGLV